MSLLIIYCKRVKKNRENLVVNFNIDTNKKVKIKIKTLNYFLDDF